MPVLIGQTSILYDNITLSQHLDTWIGWHKKATWNKFFECSPNILSGYYTNKVKGNYFDLLLYPFCLTRKERQIKNVIIKLDWSVGSGTAEHFSKWREGLVGGGWLLTWRRQAWETLLLVNLHFVGKVGGRDKPPVHPQHSRLWRFEKWNYNPSIKQHKHWLMK